MMALAAVVSRCLHVVAKLQMLARHQRAGWVARSEIHYGLFSAGLPTMGFAALNPSTVCARA
jgi:hypothetical protein